MSSVRSRQLRQEEPMASGCHCRTTIISPCNRSGTSSDLFVYPRPAKAAPEIWIALAEILKSVLKNVFKHLIQRLVRPEQISAPAA